LEKLVDSIGGKPSHPMRNRPSDAYWEELRVVINARTERLNNMSPARVLPQVPMVWANFTLADIAEAVHNEYPGEEEIVKLSKSAAFNTEFVIFRIQPSSIDRAIYCAWRSHGSGNNTVGQCCRLFTS